MATEVFYESRMRTLSGNVRLGMALLAGALCMGRDAAALGATFPGPEPGAAQAKLTAETLTLTNQALEVGWRIDGGRPLPDRVANRLTGETLRGEDGELLTIVCLDGATIRASDLHAMGTPTLTTIEPQPKSVRRCLRFRGWRAEARLRSADRALTVIWQAELRDGSNVVIQRVIVPYGQDAPAIKAIRLLDLAAPSGRTVGTVDGSPLVAGSLFLGCMSPLSTNRAVDGRTSCVVPVPIQATPERPVSRSAVIGVAPANQMRRAVLVAVERRRPRPYKPFVHYNSWYDIAWKKRKMSEARCLERIETFGRALAVQRNAPLDAFVFDDGWDDNATLWRFHADFPVGFKRLAKAAAKYGSTLGAWLSPWGGYGAAKAERLEYGATQGFETNSRGFSLAGPKYYERFRSVCAEMVREHGVGFFKFDGVGKGSDTGGAGEEFAPDIEALFRLLGDLRRIKPDIYLNVTAGTWPSPFWLLHSDAVWRGGRDAGHTGPGRMRQRWLTYRDGYAHRIATQRGPLFPLNSLKSQGLCLGQLGRDYHKMNDDEPDIIDEIRMNVVSGTQQIDLFVTPSTMTPRLWDALAEAMRWARDRVDVLVDTHWIGGDPTQGEVYGYASWAPGRAVIGLRNPSDKPARYRLDVGEALELPDRAAKRWRLTPRWTKQPNRRAISAERGTPVMLDLPPFELLVLEGEAVRMGG